MTRARASVAKAATFTVGFCVFAATGLGGAFAQTPELIKEERDWKALQAGSGSSKVCYVISTPQRLEPSNLSHGDVYFFISTRPGENIREEPSVHVGYNFREGSQVKTEIGGQNFTMFTKGDGAWLESAADEPRLVQAMRAGSSMVVSGVSGRGNNTTYTFSLSGISATLDAMGGACR